jgi:hypothetical protein
MIIIIIIIYLTGKLNKSNCCLILAAVTTFRMTTGRDVDCLPFNTIFMLHGKRTNWFIEKSLKIPKG